MVSFDRAALRRVVGRGRRTLDDLRPPRRTALRWLHVADDGAIAFGKPRTTLAAQPPGRVRLGPGARVHDHVEFLLGPEGEVEIGADTVIGTHVLIAADRLVRIGAGCRIGTYSVLTDTWTYGWSPTDPPAPAPEPVTVGDGARLGMRVILGPGVDVGPGEVVATGTLRHRGPEVTG